MMKWKAIFFDLHDTLVDTRKSYRESLKEMLDLFLGRWSEVDDTKIENVLDPLLKALKRYPRQHYVKKGMSIQEYRHLRIKNVLEPIGIPVTREFSETLLQQWNRHYLDVSVLYPSVKNTLSALHRQIPIVIVSNGNAEVVHQRIKQLDLDKWAPNTRVFTPTDGVRKPNPSIFHQVLKEMGVAPGECLFVGNSWKKDVKGALNVGMKAVWFNPHRKKKPEGVFCYEIHSFDELIPLVQNGKK
jgi:putative hydrolase of the HAD superfamily